MTHEPDQDKAKIEMLYPAIPEGMADSAVKVWNHLVIPLVKQGTLTENELPLFVEYCQCVGEAQEFEDFLSEEGEIYVDDNGEQTIRREVELRNRCLDRSHEIAPLLGIGFPARSSLEEPKIERKKRKRKG